MSAEHYDMAHDCIIVPNSDCPNDCKLQRVSKYDIVANACESNENPTFFQYIDPEESVVAHMVAIRLNMKRAILHYNASPRSCKNLQELLKSARDEE